MRSARSVLAPLIISLLTLPATPAAAHCCHDERNLGIAMESGLRRGVRGMDGGLDDEPVERDPPSIGNGLGSRSTGLSGGGGLGQLQGNSIGNYGAGSLGERGPGGLGALRGDSILTEPPRPR